ncbi:sporulation protein YqfD [Paenibacillus rhizoplanae]
MSGPQVEKFINAVTGAGIIIWDVRPAGDGASLNLLLDDFFSGFARSSKRQAAACMLQPGNGLPFSIARLWRRKFFCRRNAHLRCGSAAALLDDLERQG